MLLLIRSIGYRTLMKLWIENPQYVSGTTALRKDAGTDSPVI